jgi:hypothetical protein
VLVAEVLEDVGKATNEGGSSGFNHTAAPVPRPAAGAIEVAAEEGGRLSEKFHVVAVDVVKDFIVVGNVLLGRDGEN